MINRFAPALCGICSLIIATGNAQPAVQRTPEQAARAIVARIVRETSFDLQLVPQKPVLDIQVVDFGTMFGTGQSGIAFALSNIYVERDTFLTFGMSRDLPLTIWLNGVIAYTAQEPSPFVFKEIGYEIFRFNDTLQLLLKRGNNEILVSGRLSGEHNVLYLRELNQPGSKPYSRFDLGGTDPSLHGESWISSGTYGDRDSSMLHAILPHESGSRSAYSVKGNAHVWRPLPAQSLKELSIKPDAVYRRESFAEWQYPNGTVMLSLLDFAAAVHDTSIIGFVKRFCDFTVDNLELFRSQYERSHAFRGTNHRLIRRGMLDDTGGPALPFVEMLLRTHNPRLEQIVADVARYIMNEQMRLDDSTFCRYERTPGTVWADDLFMSVPFLMRMGRLTGEPRYYDDAARQAVNFNKYLRDPRTGLYRHGWFGLEKRQSNAAWGRANGWVVWATSELLKYLPATHPSRGRILDIYRQHLTAIVTFQAPSGLWYQVLDRPDSFEETSCTAMFMIGMVRGLQLGVLDESFAQSLKKAWSGVQTKISEDGIVKDICRGTGMSDDYDFYQNRERFDNDPRGLGAVITACVEMISFENRIGRER